MDSLHRRLDAQRLEKAGLEVIKGDESLGGEELNEFLATMGGLAAEMGELSEAKRSLNFRCHSSQDRPRLQRPRYP